MHVAAAFAFLFDTATAHAIGPPPPPPAHDRAPASEAELFKLVDAAESFAQKRDYDRAIENISQAIERARVRTGEDQSWAWLQLRLAELHLAAFDRDGRVGHLASAKGLLKAYSGATVEQEEERMAKLSREIDRRVPASADEAAPAHDDESSRPPPPPPVQQAPDRRMLIAGSVVTGSGGGLAIAFFIELGRNVYAGKQFKRYDERNLDCVLMPDDYRCRLKHAWKDVTTRSLHATIATGVVAGAALAAGITLLVVDRRRSLRVRGRVASIPTPLFWNSGAGIGLRGRF